MLLPVLICVVTLVLYFVGTKNFNYWKNKGVKFEKPTIFFGNNLEFIFQKICHSDWFVNLYRKYPNEKYVGFFMGTTPSLLIRDRDLIKHVLVTNFKTFHDRGLGFGRNDADPMSKHIIKAEGDLWKLLRQKLYPAFSIAKLKAMFPLMVQQTDKLTKVVKNLAVTGEEIDMRELMARYTTDFIGACGFGIDSDALLNESSDFRDLGRRIFTIRPRQVIAAILKRCFPNIFKNLFFFDPQVEQEIIGLVKQIMALRNYKPSERNDFIDIMLELRQKGKIVGESIEEFNPDGSPKTVEIVIDDLLIAAQAFIFFAAGFETSSYASSILLHVLAYHPEEQARCQQEIDEVLAKHGGKLSYDCVKEMKYLEMAMRESLRILPSPSVLGRLCMKKYTFPGTNLTIDKDVLIFISMEGLHLDERYFDDPQEFRPERFHPDKIGQMPKHVYLAFGEGPRACLGERMGVTQSIAGVATILRRCTVVPSKNSVRKPRVDVKSGVVKTIIGGLPMTLKLRK